MIQETVQEFLYTWNSAPPNHLKNVYIEEDIRDGFQAAYVHQPTLEQKKELLDLTLQIGVLNIVAGFPAASQSEFDSCYALLHHMQQKDSAMQFGFLARALIEDLEPIVALNQAFPERVSAEIYMGTSPLRRKVEQWDFDTLLHRLQVSGQYLATRATKMGVSFEDGSRTPPAELDRLISTSVEMGVHSIALCDTVGDCTPDGAARITEFTLQRIEKAGMQTTVVWHGHNDKGLSVANALSAAITGAHVISGTFLGIGERSGNTPLEQIILLLAQAGSTKYSLAALQPYCQKLAEYTHTPISMTAPLIGQQVFATSAGTHAAAILKARKLGIDFEDYIFSSVPASKLGRSQDVLLGPTSGMATARYILEQMGLPVSEEVARGLLNYAKTQDRWLLDNDIQHYVKTQGSETAV